MIAPLLETRSSLQIQNDAFRQEYSHNVNPNALRKDVMSYLGEYRFQVQKYNYELLYGSHNEELHLLDIDDHVPLISKAEKAIKRRYKEGKNTIREETELQGLINLEAQLQNANVGDQVVWISPPGPKSDGYGDYGFVYLGKVDLAGVLGGQKHLSMSAIRVDNPTLQQFNSALSLLAGQVVDFEKAEEFLASPFVVHNYPEDLEGVLFYIFNLSINNQNDVHFQKIIPLLSPYIEEFIDYVKQGAPKEFLFRAFQTIELLALDLIEKYTNTDSSQIYFIDRNAPLNYAMVQYQDRTPPAVAGSCGSTKSSSNGVQSSNILNKYSTLSELFSSPDQKENSCGLCGKENDGHYHCPKCNKVYADETNVPPDKRTKVCSGHLQNGQPCNYHFNC